MGDEGLYGEIIALTGEAKSSCPQIAELAGVREAGSSAGAGDDGASSRLGLPRRARTLPAHTLGITTAALSSRRGGVSAPTNSPKEGSGGFRFTLAVISATLYSCKWILC
jgi:hypothetical protein